MAIGTIDVDAEAVESDQPGSKDPGDTQLPRTQRRLEAIDSSSRLENLPAELRSHILLSIPDLPTLRSLVHASPVLHAQYRHERDSILHACLDRELDGFLVDASANLSSRVREIGSPRTDEKITTFLDTYRGWLSGSGTVPCPEMRTIDPSRIRWMAAYHVSVARPLARMYGQWALANLKSATAQRGPGMTDAPLVCSDSEFRLSRSEEIRIFRALYRYETYYHLFGRNRGARHGAFRHHEINELFFCLFNPWETEGIGCIELFVRQRYEDIFNAVASDLHPKNIRFRQENGLFNPEGSFDLDMEHDGKLPRYAIKEDFTYLLRLG